MTRGTVFLIEFLYAMQVTPARSARMAVVPRAEYLGSATNQVGRDIVYCLDYATMEL